MILFTLLIILCTSGRVFYLLTQQWTTHRPREALREWAKDSGFKLHKPPLELPPSLAALQPLDPQIDTKLSRGSILLISLTTAAKPTAPRPVWNLLVQESQIARNPAGLRPASAAQSIIDLFTLNAFPSLLPPDRFVAFGLDSKTARALASSPARGLLPADIGLLMHGPCTTLDFSNRPFDAIEFDRMLAIVHQLARFDTVYPHR